MFKQLIEMIKTNNVSAVKALLNSIRKISKKDYLYLNKVIEKFEESISIEIIKELRESSLTVEANKNDIVIVVPYVYDYFDLDKRNQDMFFPNPNTVVTLTDNTNN